MFPRVDAVVAEAESYANILGAAVRSTKALWPAGAISTAHPDRKYRTRTPVSSAVRGLPASPDFRDFLKDEADATVMRANATESGLAVWFSGRHLCAAGELASVCRSYLAKTAGASCLSILNRAVSEAKVVSVSSAGRDAIEQFQEIKVYASVEATPTSL